MLCSKELTQAELKPKLNCPLPKALLNGMLCSMLCSMELTQAEINYYYFKELPAVIVGVLQNKM
jgi:hypothetical protein